MIADFASAHARAVSVGAVGRAAKLAAMLDGFADAPSRVAVVHSSRGFVTHTGTFGGVPVSIIATGMGLAMADFVARELRACVDATAADPVLLVRLGTCGSMAPNVPVGMLQDAIRKFHVHSYIYIYSHTVYVYF